MKKYYKLIMLLGIFFLISAIIIIGTAIYLVNSSVKPDLAIIGGADEPTWIILWSEFKMPTLAVILEFLAGIICIITALIMRKKNDKRDK